MPEIKRVDTKRKSQLKAFIDFPHDLYKGDKNYVPELYIAQRDLLTKHPFLKHSEMALFLCYVRGKVVGRIAAILNNNHNKIYNRKDGFFGFFDCINDLAVARNLFNTAEKWLKEKGAETIIGPVNPSTNETCGLLVEGYDEPPVVMMTYNFPYYLSLIEQCGFKKQTDLLAYKIEQENMGDKPLRLLQAFEKRLNSKGVTIRNLNMKDFDNEVEQLLEVYNGAWDKNMDFIPMTPEEFRYMAKDLKMIADPDFCLIAEKEGKAIGLALSIPDFNQVQRKVKRGRLFPFGLLKILLGKKHINVMRIIALGILEDYRKLGIEAVFYGLIMQRGIEKGYIWAEGSWILENNQMMNQAFKNMNGNVYKRYRLLEKSLN